MAYYMQKHCLRMAEELSGDIILALPHEPNSDQWNEAHCHYITGTESERTWLIHTDGVRGTD